MTAPFRLLALAVILAVAAPPAQASFPGRNGAVGYSFTGSSGTLGSEVRTSGLAAKRLRADESRDIVRCERTDDVPSGGDCTAAQFLSPSYSADGRRIVFDAGNQIGIVSASGGPVTLLDQVSEDDGNPAFSPNGRRIVFTGDYEVGGTSVYVRGLQSMFARELASGASDPAWSSRNEIAYVRDGNVYVTDRHGDRHRFVASGLSPDWGPGGSRLVVVRPLPRRTFPGATAGRLFVVGARGRTERRIFKRIDDASSPVWSPDGRWIAFEAFDSGVFAKQLGSARQATQVAESQTGSENAFVASFGPAWRPLR